MEPAILPKIASHQNSWSPIPRTFWESDSDDEDDDDQSTIHPIGLVQEGENPAVNQSFSFESINSEDSNDNHLHDSSDGFVHGGDDNVDVNLLNKFTNSAHLVLPILQLLSHRKT